MTTTFRTLHKTLKATELVVSKNNARKTPADEIADQELADSIASQGLLQNLVVRAPSKKGGKYLVHAGGRRLKAIKTLIKTKRIPANFEILCQVLPSESLGDQATISENTCRAPMGRLDELEAYARLQAEHGYSAEEIGKHFGKPVIEIKRVLALSAIHPKIKEACRSGKLSVTDLEAFTLTTDQARQLEVFTSLSKDGRIWGHYIKAALTDTNVRSDTDKARIVGLKAYQAAGGGIEEDLFQSYKYLTDSSILEKLFQKRVDAKIKKEGEGWKEIIYVDGFQDHEVNQYRQAEPKLVGAPKRTVEELKKANAAVDNERKILSTDEGSYTRLEKAQSKVRGLERKLEKYLEFSQAQKAESIVIISTNGGSLKAWRGLQDKKGSSKPAGSKDKPEARTSAALMEDLSIVKHEVTQVAVAEDTQVGADLATFGIAFDLIATIKNGYATGNPTSFSSDLQTDRLSTSGESDNKAKKELREFQESFDFSWFSQSEPVKSFRAWQELTPELKESILSLAAAKMLSRETYQSDQAFTDELLSQTAVQISDYWLPTADNYFGRINKSLALDHGEEITGDDAFRPGYEKKRRNEIAFFLEDLVSSRTDPWLPPFKAKA